ncbi:MAG: glycosyltransferase [Pseudomonadota bacterium]
MPAWNAAAPAGRAPAPGPPLGELLVARGVITREKLEAALAAQRGSGARLGEVLVARRLASPAAVADALGRQRDLPLVDPAAKPPDPALVEAAPLSAVVAWRALPWRADAGVPGGVIFATPEPDRAAAEAPALRRAFGLDADAPVSFAVCSADAFEAALLALPADRRALRAAGRAPARLSVRGLAGTPARALTLLAAGSGLAALLAAPRLALAALFLAAGLLTLVNLGLRLAAMLMPPAPAAPLRRAEPEAGGDALAPSVTLIIALYREPGVVSGLIRALEALDYPRERLEVLLATEEDDRDTREAIAAAGPPAWIRVIPAPPGGPRTKPRALNHALDFARGAIVGVYDAEDRPHPQQLRRVAEAFARAPARLACVQARLGFYNSAEGWLPRCFAIEYVTWFHLILPALRRLGFPVPLGGTSMFMRRRVLERLGAWDAWNVTEDADLGMRIARAGYETGLVDSETAEEAVARPLAWIRQRSRWQKGYLQTWLCHMRDPVRLLRDLGPRGFLGFQVIFLGAASAFFAQPLLWSAWIWWALARDSWALLGVSGPGVVALVVLLHLGQLVMLASTLVALRRAGRLRLGPWSLTLPLYWPLSAVSAFKGLAEMVFAPSWWDKTAHGAPGAGPRARPRRRVLREAAPLADAFRVAPARARAGRG